MILEYNYSTKKPIDQMLNESMEQMKNKGYYKAYQNKTIILVSIATKPKKISCKIEKIN
jgi:hypothetical protein